MTHFETSESSNSSHPSSAVVIDTVMPASALRRFPLSTRNRSRS
jgi:hypothetical protein